MIAEQFISQGYCITKVLKLCEVPKSSFYAKPKVRDKDSRKGVGKSLFTTKSDGCLVDNTLIVKDIKQLLSQEFIDYGYLKVTYYLQDEMRYNINHKKVYRLMKEAKLLNAPVPKQKNKKTWVKELVPKPTEPFTYWEFDIKFIYIHHLGRYAPMLSVIDVYSRYLIGWMMQWSIKKEDVIGFFDAILKDYRMPKVITVRCDNGSQFESNLLRSYLESKKIIQEFTKPATPEQNAHIESYHSIIANAVCRKFEFESLQHALEVFVRWEVFYNEGRIHSGSGNTSPIKYLKRIKAEVPKNVMGLDEKAA
jgi:putative transposase